jgi:hypothetical protein
MLRGGGGSKTRLTPLSAEPRAMPSFAFLTYAQVAGASICFAGEKAAPAPHTARAGNRRFGRLSALRAHTKAPYKTNSHRKTLRNAKNSKAA